MSVLWTAADTANALDADCTGAGNSFPGGASGGGRLAARVQRNL